MAADVSSSLVRGLSAYKDDRAVGAGEPSTAALITRDLLGGGGGGGSTNSPAVGGSDGNEFQELDLDVKVPSGWEKRLDLKSGKVYLHRNNPPASPSSSADHRHHNSPTITNLQDLNFPPSPSRITLNLFDESSLELKLAAAAAATTTTSSTLNYQSVCTLDKVKSALERAEREPTQAAAARKRLGMSSLSPSYSSSSSSIRELASGEEETEERKAAGAPVAAGCPGCLSYVLIMKSNPKCPRCNSVVPMPAMKKPRIDLNISI